MTPETHALETVRLRPAACGSAPVKPVSFGESCPCVAP